MSEGETVRIISGLHTGKSGVVIEEPPLEKCDSQIKIRIEGETHNRMFWPEDVQYEGADDPIPARVTVKELEAQKAEILAALESVTTVRQWGEDPTNAAIREARAVLAKYASKETALDRLIAKAREDIAEGRVRPMDDFCEKEKPNGD